MNWLKGQFCATNTARKESECWLGGRWGGRCCSAWPVKDGAKTQGNYPATERILEVIETGLAQGSSSGYDAEARAFGELAMTSQSQALRHIFCQHRREKDPGSDAKPGPLDSVGILGGGLMGAVLLM